VPYEIVLSRYSDIQLNTVNTLTSELTKEAKKHDGHFNGWRTPVKKNDEQKAVK
jgi:hypothetical protein